MKKLFFVLIFTLAMNFLAVGGGDWLSVSIRQAGQSEDFQNPRSRLSAARVGRDNAAQRGRPRAAAAESCQPP